MEPPWRSIGAGPVIKYFGWTDGHTVAWKVIQGSSNDTDHDRGDKVNRADLAGSSGKAVTIITMGRAIWYPRITERMLSGQISFFCGACPTWQLSTRPKYREFSATCWWGFRKHDWRRDDWMCRRASLIIVLAVELICRSAVSG